MNETPITLSANDRLWLGTHLGIVEGDGSALPDHVSLPLARYASAVVMAPRSSDQGANERETAILLALANSAKGADVEGRRADLLRARARRYVLDLHRLAVRLAEGLGLPHVLLQMGVDTYRRTPSRAAAIHAGGSIAVVMMQVGQGTNRDQMIRSTFRAAAQAYFYAESLAMIEGDGTPEEKRAVSYAAVFSSWANASTDVDQLLSATPETLHATRVACLRRGVLDVLDALAIT